MRLSSCKVFRFKHIIKLPLQLLSSPSLFTIRICSLIFKILALFPLYSFNIFMQSLNFFFSFSLFLSFCLSHMLFYRFFQFFSYLLDLLFYFLFIYSIYICLWLLLLLLLCNCIILNLLLTLRLILLSSLYKWWSRHSYWLFLS